jgi:hypothetical protein
MLDTRPLSLSQTALPVHPLYDVVIRYDNDEEHEQRETGKMNQTLSFWIDRPSANALND